MTKEEMFKLYDTLLSIGSMEDTVKVTVQPTRKTVLVLSQVIDQVLGEKRGDGTDLLTFMPAEAEELKKIVEDCLEKAGLTITAEKLKKFLTK